MSKHLLKISPFYFSEVQSGIKTFEIRYDDRIFLIGDTLVLREFGDHGYTGHVVHKEIGYITDYKQRIGYVVLGFKSAAPDLPDLLEALEFAREGIAAFPRSFGYEYTHLRRIDAAIAKAKGES